MVHRRSSSDFEKTPAGRLDEARLKRVLGYQLAQATIVTDSIFRRVVEQPLALRPVEYTVLTLVAENPGSSLARIARALSVTPPHITAVVDRLEARALLARTTSDSDRRSQVLSVTPEGSVLVRQATDQILATENAALALSPGEQAILAELLHKVACARANASDAASAKGTLA
ncbi:MarR family transcriptional regulator [Variovorax dokdonensis]|uniref:MarR family transcriptional regulator n=1 Tax=Variovorax dokdonensis TaxID=344883 RepID=A0ABT7N9V3_9BURK|nr:MarR family transcriptional regulator [Variovorax dokdonensis]MDM0044729.1 MarR family transcriptional regulator [Variovorax dokdonensis]